VDPPPLRIREVTLSRFLDGILFPMKFDFGALPAKFGKSLQKVFGSANQRSLNRYSPLVQEVNGFVRDDPRGRDADDRAAALRRAADRRHAVLHQGKIAEMATGEGKTLVATLPAATSTR
jgi:preprotein translocase subunit SecA